MIIKTLRRKDPNSFRQLVHYIGRKSKDVVFFRNLPPTEDLDEISTLYEENDKLRSTRKRTNGNAMYHEIISFHINDSPQITPNILYDIGEEYISHRAPDNLVFGSVHRDRDHIHLHFIISANEAGMSRVLMQDNKAFLGIRTHLEQYQQLHYPQLSNSIVYTNKPRRKRERIKEAKNTKKQTEFQARKQGKILKKDLVHAKVLACLIKSSSLDEFAEQLHQANLPLYSYKHKIRGVKDGNKKYRFSTLNIDLSDLIAKQKALSEAESLRIKEAKAAVYPTLVPTSPIDNQQQHETELEQRIKTLETIQQEKKQKQRNQGLGREL